MALTDAQKVDVRRHLGYSTVAASLYPIVDVFHSIDQVLSSLPAATETAVVSILGKLSTLETQIGTAPSRLRALKVGSIDLPGGAELAELWREVNRWRRELSTLTGLPMRRAAASVVVV